MNTAMQPQWEKKSRFLLHLLIWSGALNIGLGFSLSYLFLQYKVGKTRHQVEEAFPSYHQLLPTNISLLEQFSKWSFDRLIKEMENSQLIEEGYYARDLALCALTAFHGLDLERALINQNLQKRKIKLPGLEECEIYPGITQEQFKAVKYFIQKEAFPFTPRRLFNLIKASSFTENEQLFEAFYHTPQFTFIHAIFTRFSLFLPKLVIAKMMTQGSWQMAERFVSEQKAAGHLSENVLHHFLLDYIDKGSLIAAKILLQWDKEFVLKRMDDEKLCHLIDLFPEPWAPFEGLLKQITTSLRKDEVLEKAARKLLYFAQIEPVSPYDHAATLERLNLKKEDAILVVSEPNASASVAEEKRSFYTVQRGDNLWKIAKKYQISLDDLCILNQLESDFLKEGQTLILPQKK